MNQNRWNRNVNVRNDNDGETGSLSESPYTTEDSGTPAPTNPPVTQTIAPDSDYPFTINLKSSLTDVGDDDEITVTNIREISDSSESTDWDADNPEESFAVPNEDDTLTYAPKGTYFRNALIVEMEVAAPAAPAVPDPNIGDDAGDDDDDDAAAPEAETVEVFVPIEKNIIGNSDAHKLMWHTQSANGTCAAMAVGAVLAEKGTIDDQWQVLEDGTLVIGPDGTRLNTPTLLGSNNEAPFVVFLQTQAEVDRFRREGVRWIQKVNPYKYPDGTRRPTAEKEQLQRDYPSTTKIVPNDGRFVDQGIDGYFSDDDTRWTDSFFEHYDEVGRLETATDFATIITELHHGNPVILRVDGAELRGERPQADRFETIMDDNDRIIPHAESNGTHVVWLSSIDNTDPDNPKFNVIDSAVPGGKRQYSLREITAAAEDSEFAYISTGTRPAYLDAVGSYETLTEKAEPKYSDWVKSNYRAAQAHAQGNPGRDRPDEVPPPAITTERAKEITGKDSVAEAWAVLYTLDLNDLGDYPEIVNALPDEEPLSSLGYMVNNLNLAKRGWYRLYNFDDAAFESLKTSLDVE